MKRIFFLIILFPAFLLSQNIRLEGVILDDTGHPLEMANVMAVNSATKAMDSYAITNDKGKYQLSLAPNATYSVKISYLGMKPKDMTITTAAASITQNISLESGSTELEGVEIVREMPVSISGDTISYNTDSFKSGTERKLEDVLKKLPGVEVNKDGEVEVEGKKVQKLMVEGKDFFDGDTKLGVKNIPADAIDKVQVLRNYNDIGALKGLENNEESVAMNIKLKEGKKNFWFGDMTAGTGVGHEDSRYEINPKVFYYSPEYSINVIGNFNNIGELPFTPQDYFKFTGGFRNFIKKGGTAFNVTSNDLGISLLRNDRAKEIKTDFGAANFSYNVTKSWNLSGFAILSSTLTDLDTHSRITRRDNIVAPNGDAIVAETDQETQENTHQRSNLGLFKLSSSYKPTKALQVDYDALLKHSGQNEYTDLFTTTQSTQYGNDAQNISTLKKQDPLSLNQNFSVYFTQSDKNTFALEVQHLYQNEDPFYEANLARNPFPDSLIPAEANDNIGITDAPSGRYDLNQNRFARTNKLDSKLDYYYMLTPKSNINFTFGDTYSYQDFDSDLFQILDGQSINGLQPNSENDVQYRFNDAFLGAHLKFITGKFTINPGASFHAYHTNNIQKGTDEKDDFYRLLPDVFALYQIKKSETLTYNYAMTTNFTDIRNLAEGYVMNSYNALFRGNRNLDNELLQTHSLRYFKYNMFNFTNIFGFINYTKRIDAVKTKAKFIGINQSSIPYNSDFADENLAGVGNYGRSFGKYKASVNANLNWSKFHNIRVSPFTNVEVPETTESFTQSYTAKISTNYKHLPNLELGYNVVLNHYDDQDFYTQTPSARLDYYFLDAFSFVADYEYYHYSDKDKTISNEYDFLNASLIYQKKGSKWEYKLAATNLLDTRSLNDDSFSQFSTRTSQYVVQPRYVIFSLKYNL